MGEFGWAFISGSDLSAAQGTNGSVQLRENGGNNFSGSSELVFDSSNNLRVTGAVLVSGNISSSVEVSASAFYGDGSNLTGIGSGLSISSDGANRVLTSDGDNTLTAETNLIYDGTNLQLTGSQHVQGELSASLSVSASAFYGDGSNLTNLPAAAISSYTNAGDNRILTSVNASTVSGEPNLTFDGSTMILTGTLNVTGAINANEFNVNVTNQSVINLTATGSTIFGDTSDDIHQFTGSVFLNGQLSSSANLSASAFYGDGSNLTNVSSPLIIKEEGSNITTSAASINFVGAFVTASTSGDDVTVKVNAGGGGGGGSSTIGAAEDGDYTDGLFTDFTNSTAIGVPIDRFNEVLKILAPTPAPAVSSINEDVTDGVTAKLSFGAAKPLGGYVSSGDAAGFSAVARAGSYAAATSDSNIRLGVYDGTQDITGFINHHVVESVTNTYSAYSNDAFGNANEGTLKLELNGVVVHSIALSGLAGSGNPNTGSANSLTGQSGFTNVSVTASSFDGNNAEWYIFKYRTAKYKIAAADQKDGWNYLRVVHSLSTDNATNYIEWINDPSGAVDIAEMSASNPRIENVSLVGSKFLSGVEYNTDATANYKTDLLNLYNNTYPASGTPISFATSNSVVPSAQSVSDIAASETATKVLGVTGSLNFNQTTLFDATMSCNVTVTHPIKETISNTGSAEANGFLIETRTLASNNLEEKFHDESLRKTSGAYDTQGSVTAAASIWNSENHMTGGGAAGHTDGLLFHNQRLYSPVDGDIPNGGNFSTIPNVEANQPNYSGVTGTRTFYRVLTNSSGVTKRDIKIVSTKNSTSYNNSTLGASNVHFFAKIPGTTGWMDISQNFSYGNIDDDDGALIPGANNDTDSGNNTHHVTFGTASVANGEYIMLKILADESWSGYINELSFSLGASTSTVTDAPVLDDIDANNNGANGKLSFGASNGVSGYTNANGSSISLSDFNSNNSYTLSGDRRGIFSFKQNLVGNLNEDVSANGNNYPVDSFRHAYSGSINLEVNGSEVHRIYLTSSLNTISSSNSNHSGIAVSALDFGKTSSPENVIDYTKTYRTGSYTIGPNEQNLGWNYARVVHNLDALATQTIIVTVADGIFHFDGVKDTALSLKVGNTYRFDITDGTNGSHPLRFSTTSDGTHGGGSQYTTGVTVTSDYIQIIPQAAVTLYPYCTSHGGMGGSTQLNITVANEIETNYVEWIVDTDANALTATVVSCSNFNHLDVHYQSGVRYFASRPSASYSYTAGNVYRNIYSNESLALQFPTSTNCSISNIRITGDGVSTFDSAVSSTGLPNLNNSADCEADTIQVTGTVRFDDLTSISGAYGTTAFTHYDISVNSAIHHPLKTDITSSTQSKNSFMVYSGSLGSTNLTTNEYFNTEDYRIVSGNYVNQADAINGSNAWNPQTHMNAANAHGDGMVTVNGYAISPLKIGNDGDTRNADEGGSLQAPIGSPDYSTLSEDIRTYYRYFRNTTGLAKPTFTVTLYGKGNLVAKSGAFYTGTLGANDNINVELKVPYDPSFSGADDTSTAWGDIVKPYSAGVQPTADGVGVYSGGGSGLDQNLNGGAAVGIQLQEKQVRNNQYFVIKISAHKDWTGYISRILITY